MAPKKKKQSLAEKIGSIITEGSKSFGSDDEDEETKAKVDEYDDESDDIEDFKNEFNRSSIRKQNVNLLEEADDRYKAKKVSKKELFNHDESSEDEGDDDDDEDDNDEEEEEEDDDEDVEESDGQNVQSESESEQGNESNLSGEDEKEVSNSNESISEDESLQNESVNNDASDDYDELDDSVDLSNPLRRDRGPKEGGIKTVSDINIRAEIEKGNCVRSQLQLWENFLEMRIQLQKCLINSNKMPQYDAHKVYSSDKEFKKNTDSTKAKLSDLLINLLNLQNKLLNKFPETKDILSGVKKDVDKNKNGSAEQLDSMDEEIPSDSEDEINGNEENISDNEEENNSDENDEMNESESDSEDLKEPSKKKRKLEDFEKTIAKNHKAYAEYRDSVIQKWNDKVRVSSGVIKKGPNQPALKQIEFALINKDKLIKKSQLKRSEYEIVGKSMSTGEDNDGRRIQEYDTEIYDDDDFYHQLLRELIEQKSADITDPIQLSKQWIQLQNLRKKMKRKIDTRATKGRRLRYDVHQKLVNFMAPITVNDTWTDYAKNELYNSLFGKIKSVGQETSVT